MSAPNGLHPNCVVLNSRAITILFTVIRDKNTSVRDYVFYSDRLMRILAEEGLAQLATVVPRTVETPCGVYHGLALPPPETLCCVSVVRSGDILLEAVRQLSVGIAVGKILVQRDETDKEKRPVLFYNKLPPDVAQRQVLLVDPMLATGGSAKVAIKLLLEAGVPAKNIIFLNVVSCPEGLTAMAESYPEVKIVTCAVDERLNDQKFIVPGLGDYGDRYYST
eukprot:TRINITY_DN6724_c0_g1_i1.p1 TRINITY_DN6724_c0_g1~~TRINITY_DN6724_c0_g1_i1.p1  ORF type:complete len:222 (+),score=80.94 TRINITY_DN6724_c0_g1_i1:2-667(+)